MTIFQLLISSIIVFVGHLIKSISGFGAALFSIPILTHFVDLKILVPLFALFDLYSGVVVVVRSKKVRSDRAIRLIILGLLVGTFVGSRLFINLRTEVLRILFAIVVGLFAIRTIFFSKLSFKKVNLNWGIVAGFLGGLSGAMFGVNGPPIVMFYTSQVTDKLIIRTSLFGVFLVDAIWKIILYIQSGVIDLKIFLLSLIFIPIVLLGINIGKRVHLKISDSAFKRVIGMILLVSCVMLLLR